MKKHWKTIIAVVVMAAVVLIPAYYVNGVYLPNKSAAEAKALQAEQDRLLAAQQEAEQVEPGSTLENDPTGNGGSDGDSDPEGGSTATGGNTGEMEPGSTPESDPTGNGGSAGDNNPEGDNVPTGGNTAEVEPGSTPENDPTGNGSTTGGGGSSDNSGSHPGSEWEKPEEDKPGYIWVPGFGWIVDEGGGSVELEHSEGYVSSGELSGNKIGYMGSEE